MGIDLAGSIVPGPRPDWYDVPPGQAAPLLTVLASTPLAAVPGVQIVEDKRRKSLRIFIHRSHLPLLEHGVCYARPHAVCSIATAASAWRPLPRQVEGALFLRTRRGAALIWEMRLGKTPAALLAHDLSDGPLAIVCPPDVRAVWEAWVPKVFPGVEPVVLEGRTFSKKYATAPVVILHYHILQAWQSLKPARTIFDEAHVLSNARAEWTGAALGLATRSGAVNLLTGTPVWNQPRGLFPLLQLVNPGAWGTKTIFGQRYCGWRLGERVKKDTVTNAEELGKRLSEVVNVLSWADVGSSPDIERSVVKIALTPGQHEEIDLLAHTAFVAGDGKGSTIGAMGRLRKILGKVKAPVAMEEAKKVLSAGKSIIVWTWHRETAEQIGRALWKDASTDVGAVFIVTGDDTQAERAKRFAQWKACCTHRPSVLVLTIAVGQAGIDLSAADTEIFAEQDFTPAVLGQAEMRPYSPLRPTYAKYIVTDHWIDDKTIEALQRKEQFGQLLGLSAGGKMVGALSQGRDSDGDVGAIIRAMRGEAT